MTIDYYATDLGVVPDWDGDPARPATVNAPLIMAALEFIRLDRGRGGGRLWFDGGIYLGGVVRTQQQIEIRGSGTGVPWLPGRSHDKPGCQFVGGGFRFHGMTDVDEPGWTNPNRNASGDYVAYASAGYSLVDGVSLIGAGFGGRGIHMSTPMNVERSYVEGFGDDGIAILADRTNGGSAGGWGIRDVVSGGNGGYGFCAIGGDADVGKAERLSVVVNAKSGIYDESLGNTYDACHGAGNEQSEPHGPSCDYESLIGGDATTFTGCYSEGGTNRIHPAALVVGGNLSSPSRLDASNLPRALNGQSETGKPYTHQRGEGPGAVAVQCGAERGQGVVIGGSLPSHPSSAHWELQMQLDAAGMPTGYVELIDAGNTSRRVFVFPTSALPGLQATLRFPNGIQFGEEYNRVTHTAGTSPPTDGDHPSGSICWNVGGGPVLCWRRIAGSWEAFP